MIKQSFLLLLAVFSMALIAQEFADPASQPSDTDANPTQHFISDDLFIYMHTGPGNNYRILGSVTAGTAITVLDSDLEADFTQIQDNRGRTGWVKSEFVEQGESLRSVIPVLESQLSSTRQEDGQLNQTVTQLEMELVSSKDENKLLQEQITQLQQEADRLSQQLSIQTSDSEKDWFVKGGMVSIGSVLFGVILTLILRRKKRSDVLYDRY